MSEPMRHPNDPHAPRPDEAPAARRPLRASAEDPLAELARILGESTAHPVRPENVVEVGRRVLPAKPAPQQVSDLEAELFESLRASVAPEDRVRGDFPREVPPVIPQHPVDDHDIASLGAIAAPEDPIVTPTPQAAPDPRLADYYAYDDGVTAGSWDPAFGPAAPVDLDEAFAAEIHRVRGEEPPRPTFDDFDTEAIAAAARESSPYVAEEAVILPHSAREEYEAHRVAHDGGRGFRLATAVVVVLLAGGGALAGWKYLGGRVGGGPVVIHADTTPMKVVPEPSKAPQPGDGEVSLKRDTKVDGSKIVSLQEDPVEHVAGRTADGREVRVINPGAQRPANPDQPRAVKTVVVRPDGSIVSEDGTPAAARPATTAPGAAPTATPATPPVPTVPPQGAAVPVPTKTVSTTPVTAVPPVPTVPETAVAPTALPTPVAPEVAVPLPMPAPPRPVAAAPVAEQPAPVKPAAAPPVAAPAPAKVKPPVVAKPAAPPRTPAGGAPMALGPVAPRLAAQPAPAAPTAPAAAAPAATGGAGDWVVQISASKSDADARRSLADAQRRFSALAGKSGEVQRADLGAKGTYYRARFVAGAHETAAAVCAQVRAQGGQCIVARR